MKPMQSDKKTERSETGAIALWEKVRAFSRTARQKAGELLSGWYRAVREESEEREESVFSVLIRALGIGVGALTVVTVLSMALFPLGVRPAGFALLASLGKNSPLARALDRDSAGRTEKLLWPTALAGVFLSTLFFGSVGWVYALAYLALFSVRAVATSFAFDDSLLARVTSAAASAVGCALVLAMLDSFSVNAVFGAVSFGIITPLLTYLLCGFYVFTADAETDAPARGKRKIYLEAGLFTVAYLFLFALREVMLAQFSVSFVFAAVLTLCVSRSRGALYGAAMGMVGGMACSDPAVAPALAVAGFFSGLFFEYSLAVAVMVAFVSACGYSMYTDSLRAFGLVSADFLFAVLLFLPLSRFLPMTGEIAPSVPREVLPSSTLRDTRKKLRHISDAFSSLSEVFYTVSDTMKKPQLTEISRLVTDCCSEVCSRCARASVCWGEEHGPHVDGSGRLAGRILAKGAVDASLLPAPFDRCRHREELIDLIERRYEMLDGNYLKNNKTRLLAGEYSCVSRLMSSTASQIEGELEYNADFEARAKRVLKNLALSHQRVAVFGTREIKIDVYGVRLEKVSLATDTILDAFEKEFSCRFEAPSFLMFEESVVMRLRRARVVALECAKSGCAKKGETVNGDSVALFETERDYFYTLICDGMGSGRDAAFTSRLAAIFIEKLMRCATPKNVTLEMLNSFLMAKTDETFTTVDLLEIDLYSAQANFIKAGAAPSFVLRRERLHRIASQTPPAGAIPNLCAEQTRFPLRGGDFVIQISDGAQETEEGGDWLVELLSKKTYSTAAELCEAIFESAKENGAFRDDLSVCVVRVESLPRQGGVFHEKS